MIASGAQNNTTLSEMSHAKVNIEQTEAPHEKIDYNFFSDDAKNHGDKQNQGDMQNLMGNEILYRSV